MENNTENLVANKQKHIVNFILYRIIVAILLVISLTIVKYFFASAFESLSIFYKDNISINITADYFDYAGGE